MQTDHLIEIPADKVEATIREVYDRSQAAGMGFMHYRDGPIPDKTVGSIVTTLVMRGQIFMDYVHGRQCKFRIQLNGRRAFVRPYWPDHSHKQLVDLLTAIGIADPESKIDVAMAERIKMAQLEDDMR